MRLSPFPRVRARTLLVISICLTTLVLVSFEARRQHAASIVINSTSDAANGSDGLCTLREAITAANTNVASGVSPGECVAGSSSGSDAIDATGVTGTINLATALPNITSSMTVSGPGSSQLTVRRNTGGDYRIFTVTSGNTVGFSGLTITNGKAADGTQGNSGSSGSDGGGVMNGGTLTMTEVGVTNNTAGTGGLGTGGSGGNGGNGGGIYNTGSLTMTNCTVSGNTGGRGGNGISLPGNGGAGGGIYNSLTLTMTSCVLNGNVAGRGGDDAGTFNGNGGHAGAIYNAQSSSANTTLTNVTISNNAAGDCFSHGGAGRGGGIYVSSNSIVTIVNSTINNNRPGVNNFFGGQGTGGGIANDSNGNVSILGSTINNNGPSDFGGGLSNDGVAKVQNSTFSGNNASTGGGIWHQNGALRITSCTITSNPTGRGFVASGSQPVVRNTIVAGNGPEDLSGIFNSQGHNLIGNPGTVTGFTNGVNGDQVGTSGSPLHAELGPLANNGGPTMTHALLSTSPALDAGDNCVTEVAHCGDANISQLPTDQRGTFFNRIVDGPDVNTTATVDIGAYETQVALANLADTSTNEDTQLLVAFDGGDTSTITSVTASSSNPTLVPNDSAHLAAALSGSTGIVTINPASNESGTTNITVTVNRTSGPESKTFLLTVNPINDATSFTKGADQVVNEDAGAQTVNNWATNISPGAPDESGQTLTFQITGNTNAGLFSSGPAINSSGTLTYTTTANAFGTATITVNLKDNGGTANGGADTSATQTFTITVNSVNDAPSFVKGTDRTVNEDSGSQFIFPWATSISAGPSDESGQTLTFQVTNNTNPSLFSSGPSVNTSGQLSFTPATNANGSANITIVLKDSGGTANGGADTSAPQTFTINVTSLNDAPSFTRGANQTINEDAGAQTVNNWATAISPGPANESGQTVSFNVTANTNAALFSVAPAISSNGTLTYTAATNANGSATITLVLKDDGGTANGGSDTSPSQSFTITVNAVNDAPSFAAGPNQTVNEDAGAQAVANWATSILSGPANESAQTLSFTATNDNNALFSVQPAISSTGTLTYTPAANSNGTATVSVTLKDNGGTTNGGVDTSAAQTFTITVNPINDAPSFTKGPDQNVNNNAGMQTVSNWATNISSGPANESSQTLTFQVTGNTNPGLFTVSPSISPAGTLTYQPATNAGGTATISVALQDNGGTANGGVDTSVAQSFNININPVGGSLNFSTANLNPNESSGFVTVTAKRTGDISRPVTADYATSGDNGLPCSTANGIATPKCDFTSTFGTLNFAAGEDTKTFSVLIGQDSFVEGPETFSISLLNQTGGSALGAVPTTTVTIDDDVTEPATNAIDDPDVFVRQHYHDFLNREPDPAGLAFWVSQITSCGADATCAEIKRINVSSAFFLSIEFQNTGYLVERIYKSSFGDADALSGVKAIKVPIVRLNEFLADTQQLGKGVIVGQNGWEAVLEGNKQTFTTQFVQRPQFVSAFPTSMTPAQFVDRLFLNAGVTPTTVERNAAINEFGPATTTSNIAARSRALRDVAENSTLNQQEFNRAFVLAEYLGYLRRNPNDAPELTLDYAGYDFWLTKLNQFNGNYINAEMVKAFLSSIEYRQRFGP
jgi:CSLREA domain-containing protein